jgi:hypothetical protein
VAIRQGFPRGLAHPRGLGLGVASNDSRDGAGDDHQAGGRGAPGGLPVPRRARSAVSRLGLMGRLAGRSGWPGSRRRSARLLRLAAGLGLLALGACSSTAPEAPAAPLCPAALLLEGAERTTAYRAGAEPRPSELRYLAVLTDLSSACRYYDDSNGQGVDVDLSFNVIAERGPALSDGEELAYFVATVGPDSRILARDLLRSDLTFAEGEERAGWSEDLTLRLPSVTPGQGRAYTLYVGFPLDDAELARRRQPLIRQAP